MSDTPRQPGQPSTVVGLAAHADLIAGARAEFERFRHERSTAGPAAAAPGDAAPRLLASALPGYTIREELARGGQGVVYRAVQQSTGRDVAIKIMREGPFASPAERARFEREVRLLARLRHPSIVAIHDSGEAAGFQYFVMDFIDGPPLDEWVAGRNYALRPTLLLFAQICEAVEAAHVRGIIHRDLKPANIRVDAAGVPHVLDFGLAKHSEADEDAGLTQTGQFIGSLPWASPEQLTGGARSIDTRSDVYSLGVMLYAALARRHPHDLHGGARDVLDRIVRLTPPALRPLRDDIDDELETIVLTCLAKEPQRRYQTAGELARDLRNYLAGAAISAKRDSGWYIIRKQLRRHRGLLAAASAFLGLLVISSAVAWSLYVAAQQARRDEQARLWETYVAQARAERSGASVGRRDASLRAIRDARALRNGPLLRTEAIASLALTDLVRDGDFADAGSTALGLHVLDRYARQVQPGVFEVRRAREGALLTRLPCPITPFTIARFSPDGRYLAIRADTGERVDIDVWDLASGECRLHLDEPGQSMCAPRDFDRAGRWIACTTGDGLVDLHALSSGRLQTRIRLESPISAVAAAPDGGSLALASYAVPRIWIWDIEQGAVVRAIPTAAAVLSLAWSRDGGRLAAGATDHNIYLFDGADDLQPRVLTGHQAQVSHVAFDRTGRVLASSGWDDQTRLWDLETAAPLAAPLVGYRLVAFADQLLLEHPEGSSLWRIEQPEIVRTLRLPGVRETLALAAPPQADWFVASGRTAWLGTCESAVEPRPLGTDPAGSPVAAPDGRLYGVAGGRLTEWRIALDGIVPRAAAPRVIPFEGGARDIGLTPDGGTLVALARRELRWVAPENGRVLRELTVEPGATNPRISRDQRHVFVGNWKGPAGGCLIEVTTSRVVRTFPGEHVFGCFSPTADVLAVSDNRVVRLIDLASGAELWRIDRTTGTGLASKLAFSPDGRLLALTTSAYDVHIVDAADGARLAELPNPELHMLSDLAFARDGEALLTATTTGVIRVWNLPRLRARLGELGLDW